MSLHVLPRAISELGVKSDDRLMISINASKFRRLVSRDNLVQHIGDYFFETFSQRGVLLFSLASLNLVGTSGVFSMQKTPSFQRGVVNEFLRMKPGVLRSPHPFQSVGILGAKNIGLNFDDKDELFDVHSNAIFNKIRQKDFKFLSIGVHPHISCFQIHQCEFNMGVPYRSHKSFPIFTEKNAEKKLIETNLFVNNLPEGLRNSTRNKNIFSSFARNFNVRYSESDGLEFWLYDFDEYMYHAENEITKNPFAVIDEAKNDCRF